jgi:hypothetical protein
MRIQHGADEDQRGAGELHASRTTFLAIVESVPRMIISSGQVMR